MTDDADRRTQARERRRKHRRLKNLGKVTYYVRAHEERLREALRKFAGRRHEDSHQGRGGAGWADPGMGPD
jgi:hypothetical protein